MFWLEPVVDGGLGPGADYDGTRHPRLVGELAYEFEDWSGDDVVQTAGYWLVSDRLAQALRASELTGWALDTVRVSTSGVFEDLHPDGLEMPHWHRLLPVGSPMDDVTLIGRTYVCVSDRALDLLRRFTIEHAEIRPVSDIPPLPTS